jgi:predicted PurR-regulated permease PerM
MRFERNVVFWVAALAVFVALLWLLSPILLPFVLGMAIAYVLDPLANQLSKRGVSRLLAAVLILGGFVVALALLVLLIAPVLAKQLSAFIDNVPVYALRLQAFVSDPSHPWIKRIIGDNLTGADKSVGDLMNQTVGYLTGLLASLWAKGQGADFHLLASYHYAGRGLLPDLRLGPHGCRSRSAGACTAARNRPQSRP